MKTRLVNVRLDEDYLRKAKKLRDEGIVLSELVREAIDARYARLAASQEPSSVKAMIGGLFERHPDPDDLPARDYDVHDARAARAAIRRRVSRRRS